MENPAINSRPPWGAAVQALQDGDPASALALTQAALIAQPEHPTWLSLHALALAQLGRAAEALPLYQRLSELQPAVASHWSNLGNALCELGREAEALPPLQRALQLGASGPDVEFAVARALVARGQAGDAQPWVERALTAAPDDVEIQLLRARVLVMLDDYDGAGAALDALGRAALSPSLRNDAGQLLLQLGLYADAEACFRAAAAAALTAADRLEAELGLMAVCERCNRLPEAEAGLLQVRALAAGCTPKQQELLIELEAQLASRRGDHQAARQGIEELLRGYTAPALGADVLTRGDLWLKLGRSCDALGDAEAAMQALQQAHQLRYQHVTATHAGLPRGDGLLAVLDAAVPELRLPQLPASDDPRDPVFLVGFPRSGTTLLEQLLDAHGALASFDEQPFLQRLVTRLAAQPPGYPAVLPTLTTAQVQSLRAAYFADVARVLPTDPAVRAVDKNPLNLVRLPLVASLFPAAQVLLALRHPCDVVLSCYMQNFRSPAFSITFESLASTARMYARVMAHYHGFADRLGLPVHALRYEDLVADVEAVGRDLFGFLGLAWSDELIGFTERARAKGAISTPSYAQVVQPVNRRAVGRWQRYRRWFDGEPLQALAPWIERYGYHID